MPTARLTVRVQPRASNNAVVGHTSDGVLRIRVTASPVDGAANDAVCRLLAKTLGVPRSTITITRGATSRNKVISVVGLSEAEARVRIGG